MIKLDNVSYSYSNKVVLRNIQLEVEKHELCALVGRNGAGKSTLIQLMLQLLPLKNGYITLNGIPIQKKGWKKFVSYLPEKFQLYQHLSAKENLEFFASMERQSINYEKIKDTLHKVGLWEDRNVHVKNYSKGMLQRLGLGIMLYYDTDILILDEPTSGLDPIGRIEILNILKSLENKTILLSSHHIEEIRQVCSHVAYLKNATLTKYTIQQFESEILLEGALV
ncbi:ABC transporter ATP-binding protein [Bacillus sp. HMF5848]|uniref:ABC transporter ATP-binding protein n=1 Tax=Bacillus sp. HMF5848 TaxID=2495421 RepID=UPI000F7A2032|nr:ABC transporter ATP-binding protein [Bacillus sp. HMF5848]RSK26603.1 ABC transporter ATP-binding protein [Bacillus sp. HMF5848]